MARTRRASSTEGANGRARTRRDPRRTSLRGGHVRPRRRLPAEERRTQLLSHALAVFAEQGLDRAGHAEIARRAGVSPAAVFVYFPSRRALVRAVLAEVERFYLAMTERHRRTGATALEALRGLALEYARSVRTHPNHARVCLHWSTALGHEAWPDYLRFQERLAERIARILREARRRGEIAPGLPAHEAALFAVACAHMVAQMQLSGVPWRRVHRFVEGVVATVLGGASKTRRRRLDGASLGRARARLATGSCTSRRSARAPAP